MRLPAFSKSQKEVIVSRARTFDGVRARYYCSS